jgi:general secretion pathway protein G
MGPGRRRAALLGRRGRRAREAGFTLVEVLVVMVIIVMLASLVAPRVIGYIGGSKTKSAKIQIESLSTAVGLFKLDTGRYPSQQEGLGVLIERPTNVRGWNGPYLQKDFVPQDPWGYSYRYRIPGEYGDFDIFSLGADDREGGNGEDQDVTNWR